MTNIRDGTTTLMRGRSLEHQWMVMNNFLPVMIPASIGYIEKTVRLGDFDQTAIKGTDVFIPNKQKHALQKLLSLLVLEHNHAAEYSED
jgi:hypothetical protein